VLGEGADRVVKRAGAMVGDEGECGSPARPGAVDPRVRRDGDEARERLGVIAHVAGENAQAEHRRRALARDRRLSGGVRLGHLCRRIRGRRGRDRLGVAQSAEEAPALVERGRMRADDADLPVLERLAGDEVVADRDGRLGDDRERRLVQQVVRLRDRADQGVLDREHTVGDLSRDGRPNDVLERLQ
jgi:hypothetical protein